MYPAHRKQDVSNATLFFFHVLQRESWSVKRWMPRMWMSSVCETLSLFTQVTQSQHSSAVKDTPEVRTFMSEFMDVVTTQTCMAEY